MRLLAMLVLVSLPSYALAQTPPLRKGFRVEAGFSDNHQGHDRGGGAAIRGFGELDQRGSVTVEGGALIGYPYLGIDGGLDARFPVRTRMSVLIRGGTGLLLEDGYFGFWRYGAGIELQLSARNRMTITYQRGAHDGRDIGPHLLMVGWERSVRRR
jgi:hypothetical protein